MSRVYLVVLLQDAAFQELVEELVGKAAFALVVRFLPEREYVLFYPSYRLVLGYAGVGHPVEALLQKLPFVPGGQVPVVRHALVMVVGHEVEDILLEVGSGAGDYVDLPCADHLGK